ncbi:nitrile hydratase accessory protein [Litorivita pollutaquae]|uniref:Nitrile hydratase accessory protein n=1 Tax=Litorivita pollutaquae TaxID=2200892 RepID=A0A2V4NGH4_9RHOB|nr:nitrile hydratase accessory protein [Litorivita pollutaquae]PYC49170.1 nitrile hydratase accessory protein [Litorivita pollutaquae]
MTDSNEEIPSTDPAFSEPWHAQLFAMTLGLSAAGFFTWTQWTEAFGARLKRDGAKRPLDGGADYYGVWLDTLEDILASSGKISAEERAQIKAAWEAAYLSTPHGKPVKLQR